MTSYIVRIYREEKNNPRNFVGTVEEAAVGEKKVFTSLDELWAILNPASNIKRRVGKHTLDTGTSKRNSDS
jgi:hypothetical protein